MKLTNIKLKVETDEPNKTLWDKRQFPAIYEGVWCHASDVKEALNEFMSEISDYWDKEALSQIAKKHFGEELIK